MAMSDTGTRAPAARRFSPAYLVIGLVVAVAAFGWAYVMAHVNQTPGIVAETLTYRVVSDAKVEINYSVTKPKDRVVRCAVRAVDTNFAEVANTEVIIPRGTSYVNRTQQLQTTARATAAQVKDCAAL
ncbi:MAG: hypothetical protein JWO67_3905 [Streptosporangiaceae bacterium]|jgi:hypothetical protein|nr:hypothetical protein [Streptosporangiaceae bacterium]